MKLVEVCNNTFLALKNFNHQDAVDYSKKMIEVFGDPDGVMFNQLYWKEVDDMKDVIVKDEKIEHNFPEKHYDFIYSSHQIEVPQHLYDIFAFVSGSIIVDGLKNLVTARCGTLYANAITLQFVKDVINNTDLQQKQKAKDEYANRIKSGTKPEWFNNSLGE